MQHKTGKRDRRTQPITYNSVEALHEHLRLSNSTLTRLEQERTYWLEKSTHLQGLVNSLREINRESGY